MVARTARGELPKHPPAVDFGRFDRVDRSAVFFARPASATDDAEWDGHEATTLTVLRSAVFRAAAHWVRPPPPAPVRPSARALVDPPVPRRVSRVRRRGALARFGVPPLGVVMLGAIAGALGGDLVRSASTRAAAMDAITDSVSLVALQIAVARAELARPAEPSRASTGRARPADTTRAGLVLLPLSPVAASRAPLDAAARPAGDGPPPTRSRTTAPRAPRDGARSVPPTDTPSADAPSRSPRPSLGAPSAAETKTAHDLDAMARQQLDKTL